MSKKEKSSYLLAYKYANMKNVLAFSMIELMVSVVVVCCITASLTPTITRKLKTAAITVSSGSSSNQKLEFRHQCTEEYSSDCLLCNDVRCNLCVKECAEDEYLETSQCKCISCAEAHDANCAACTNQYCTVCKPGYSLTSTNTCQICPQGQYGADGLTCTPADLGNHVPTQGASSQTQCEAGTYSNALAQSECNPCLAGTYQLNPGKSYCDICEDGFACSGANIQECEGLTGSNDDKSACEACPSNCADCVLSSTCLSCVTGHYLINGRCEPCPPGSSCDGSADITACESGKYSAQGAAGCLNCSYATPNCTICESPSGTCTACESGYELKDGVCESLKFEYTYEGGTAVSDETNKVIELTSSGTFIPTSRNATATIYLVGGGGGGGASYGKL